MTVTKNERKQLERFQNAVADIIDQYLENGLDPEKAKQVLEDEAAGVIERQKEIQRQGE